MKLPPGGSGEDHNPGGIRFLGTCLGIRRTALSTLHQATDTRGTTQDTHLGELDKGHGRRRLAVELSIQALH